MLLAAFHPQLTLSRHRYCYHRTTMSVKRHQIEVYVKASIVEPGTGCRHRHDCSNAATLSTPLFTGAFVGHASRSAMVHAPRPTPHTAPLVAVIQASAACGILEHGIAKNNRRTRYERRTTARNASFDSKISYMQCVSYAIELPL